MMAKTFTQHPPPPTHLSTHHKKSSYGPALQYIFSTGIKCSKTFSKNKLWENIMIQILTKLIGFIFI